MPKVSHLDSTVSASNRLSVMIGFLADDPLDKNELIGEALKLLQTSLLELSQTGQTDEVAKYLKSSNEFVPSSSWHTFVAEQIATLQNHSLHQKLIEQLGDDLAKWTPTGVAPATFLDAVRQLEFSVMLDTQRLTEAWCSVPAMSCCEHIQSLLDILTAIVLIRSNNSYPIEDQAFTAVSFAAHRIWESAQNMAN